VRTVASLTPDMRFQGPPGTAPNPSLIQNPPRNSYHDALSAPPPLRRSRPSDNSCPPAADPELMALIAEANAHALLGPSSSPHAEGLLPTPPAGAQLPFLSRSDSAAAYSLSSAPPQHSGRDRWRGRADARGRGGAAVKTGVFRD
jgi:hypothetical protein